MFKRYIFETGLDIIAPLKCGTRWLEGLDVNKRTHLFDFRIEELKKNIHSGTTFIWRPVREHFVSAMITELATRPEKTPSDIITLMESGICGHWYPYLYKELYDIWSQTPFRFYKLRALSELNQSTIELEYNSTSYDFRLPTEWDSIESVLNTVSPKHIILLNKLIDDENNCLTSILKSQYSEKSWEAYSDLEDSFLEMKIRIKDMETELKGLKTIIKELGELNTKLKAKLEYAENIIGKLPKKLI